MRRVRLSRVQGFILAAIAVVVLASGFAVGHLIRAAAPAPSTAHRPAGENASLARLTPSPGGATATPRAPAASAAIGTWVNITPPGISLNSDNPPNNFGMQVIQADAQHSGTVYVGTCYQGIWKTTDGGTTWKKVNTGVNGSHLDEGRIWGLALDHFDSQLLWAANGAGGMQGIWRSTDGGVDWSYTNIGTVNGQSLSNDVYSYATDPYAANHVLVTFHTGWNAGSSAAGFLESFDAGKSWIVHQPPLGSNAFSSYIFFLGDSKTWLLTEEEGYYRTADGGRSWKKVSDAMLQHGGNQVYRARNGALYVGAVGALMRSTDDGVTWTAVAQTGNDGYNAVIGDGTYLFVQEANTGGNTAGSPQPYLYSREDDGVTWRPYNSQRFADGPMSLDIDPATATIYSSNWDAGVWKLVRGG